MTVASHTDDVAMEALRSIRDRSACHAEAIRMAKRAIADLGLPALPAGPEDFSVRRELLWEELTRDVTSGALMVAAAEPQGPELARCLACGLVCSPDARECERCGEPTQAGEITAEDYCAYARWMNR